MATSDCKNRNPDRLESPPPPKKKLKSAANMKDDARDSLVDFQSSIFDASDGHKLVDFIRKKKGLGTQPQKIFDDVRTDRKSLQIEIQMLNEDENTLRPEEPDPQPLASEIDNETELTNKENANVPNSFKSPRIPPVKSPSIGAKVKLKRLSHSIGRRTLLKEFEKTLQESRFLPQTCSTPVTASTPSPNKQALSVNLNAVCTPITITDEDSPSPCNTSKEHSKKNQTLTETGNTEYMMRDLQQRNDMLLALANSDEGSVNPIQMSPEGKGHDDKNNSHHLQPSSTSTPTKKTERRTYTIHRESPMGNNISFRNNPSEEQQLPKTPLKNTEIHTRKLIVTPEQRKLLLSKFGRHVTGSPQRTVSLQKTSRIPVIMKGMTTDAANVTTTYQGSDQRETSQIIEQLQKSGLPSNAPVIVIPVNQTFNQAPRDSSQTPAIASAYAHSPNSHEISSTTTTTVPQPEPEVIITPTPKKSSAAVNSLRLADIITDDDSSSSDDNQQASRYLTKTEAAANQRSTVRSESKFNFVLPPPRSSSRHVRELMTSRELSQMTVNEILDLRKRNSNGELRTTLRLSKHESSMLDKRVTLELLRRNIQEKNYEDEVLQMEVLPPPPENFTDKRKSAANLHKSVLHISPVIESDLVDERSSDRISMSQEPPQRFSLIKGNHRPRKKKKMSEQMEKYLKASQVVSKSKYLNLSKRKLYSKGNSEPPSSNESSPSRSPSYRSANTQTSVEIPDVPRSPTTYPSPPADFANKSVEKTQFLPNDDEIFKKPMGRPPIRTVTKQLKKKSAPENNRSTTTKKKKRTPSVSHFVSPSSNPPVDPVGPDETTHTNSNMNETGTLRRSKRGMKPLIAYWSNSQKEYAPLYDISKIQGLQKKPSVVKQKAKTSRKAKNLSSSEDNLVRNTKKTQSNSVGKPNSEKESKKKLESKQSKRKENKSKPTTDVVPSPSECPSETIEDPENSQPVMDKLSDFEVTDGEATKSNSPEALPSTSTTSHSKSQSDDIPGKLSTITEDTLLTKPPPSKSKKNQPNVDGFASENEPRRVTRAAKNSVRYVSKPITTKPKSKRGKPKKKQTSVDSYSTSSDCTTDPDPSSIQQIRLTTIAEDSVPTLGEQVTISVSDLDKTNKNQLSCTLMPPPASNIVRKKSKNSKRTKKDAFRTGHDESIADASSVHVNELFNQLKSSSVCLTADDTVQHMSSSGQVSLGSQVSQSKCKNCRIRLTRVKARKPLAEINDKVGDSGFSSEDMASEPKQKGDILLDWLKQIMRNGKSSSNSQRGMAKFLPSDGLHAGRAEDLMFQEIDGVDYAFYNSKQKFSIGYMRFKPKTEKKKCTAKKYELNFVVLCGSLIMTANNNTFDFRNGDLITVFIGTSYGIKNISNDPALVMVIKK